MKKTTGAAGAADSCWPCNNMTRESSVDTCLRCTNSTFAGCIDANCSAGFYDYNSAAFACQTCTAVANATEDAPPWTQLVCTTANNSRLCPDGDCERDGCKEGFFRSDGSSSLVADTCVPCSDMADVVSVASCSACADASSAGCLTGNCAPGYHTFRADDGTCTPCTPIANAEADAKYVCTDASVTLFADGYDGCAEGYFLKIDPVYTDSGGAQGNPPSCDACVDFSETSNVEIVK